MRMLAVLAAAATAAALLSAAPAHAADDTPGCVTLREFHGVHTGQTRHHVHHVWGTSGHLVSGSTMSEEMTRGYRICRTRGDSIFATFDFDEDSEHWYLTQKTLDDS